VIFLSGNVRVTTLSDKENWSPSGNRLTGACHHYKRVSVTVRAMRNYQIQAIESLRRRFAEGLRGERPKSIVRGIRQ